MNVNRILRLFALILLWTSLFIPGPHNASSEIIQDRQGKVFLKSQDSTLKEIIGELKQKYAIEIDGLKSRENERIAFSFEAESLEALLKKLLRYLGIKNYAIEFADAALKRVVVVPEPKSIPSADFKAPGDELKAQEFVDVAQIQSIIASSQAESLGLFEGDIILEYGGVRITSARQLVTEVEKRKASNQIEMLIVRENIPQRITLAGGFIGIRIRTTKISKEELNSYFLPE